MSKIVEARILIEDNEIYDIDGNEEEYKEMKMKTFQKTSLFNTLIDSGFYFDNDELDDNILTFVFKKDEEHGKDLHILKR